MFLSSDSDTIDRIPASQPVLQLRDEISSYLNRPVELNSITPLGYWQLNSTQYPHLAKLSQATLAIPVTSVPSESSFSDVGRVMDDFRCSMKTYTLMEQVCLKSWMKLLK
jgi:hypothetical protein